MKFTKIFDMTDESPMASNQNETDTNEQAEDNEMSQDEQEQNFQHDIEVLLPESMEIMGDWTCSEIKVDEINSDALENDEKRENMSPTGSSCSIESMDSFYKPEADQSEHDQNLIELRRDVRE